MSTRTRIEHLIDARKDNGNAVLLNEDVFKTIFEKEPDEYRIHFNTTFFSCVFKENDKFYYTNVVDTTFGMTFMTINSFTNKFINPIDDLFLCNLLHRKKEINLLIEEGKSDFEKELLLVEAVLNHPDHRLKLLFLGREN